MFSSLASNQTATGRRFGISSTLILSGALLLTLFAAGCGGDEEKSDIPAAVEDVSAVVAVVGDHNITSSYYEERLSKLASNELPTDKGVAMPSSSEASKRAFLDVLINKELMAQKAVQIGYDTDPGIMTVTQSMTEYEGGLAMWSDVVGDISRSITEEELQAHYAMMGTDYLCNYVICNFEDAAMEAREFALTGADWEDVVEKFHDGGIAPTGRYEINVPFGQYSSEFEDPIFATEVGGITMPVITSYGYWILRVKEVNHKEKVKMEKAKGRILDVTYNRKSGRLRADFKKLVREKYEFYINEDALWVTYQGVPEGGLMDPATDKPYTREDLKPLDVKSKYLGEILYSYKGKEGKLQEFSVADYKQSFDKMGVFQRPKKSDMLGGFRQKLTDEVERGLMNLETQNRGYFEHPDVLAKVKLKAEEAMVTRLYNDVVTFDDKISAEQLDEFWAEHQDEYQVKEARTGHLVICLNQTKAENSIKALANGKTWNDILVKFGSDPTNKAKGGKTDPIFAANKAPISQVIFGLEVGEISKAFAFDENRYAVVRLDGIAPPRNFELSEVSEAIGGRMRNARQEDAFRSLLAQWTGEIGVQINSENLAGLKSWEELTAPDTSLVPIN